MRSRSVVWTFGLLSGLLAAGYGVLFTMLDDYRDTYGIHEGQLGGIIAIGFFAGFVSQLLIAPYADRGHARLLVLGGVMVNVAGVLGMAAAHSFLPLLLGRLVAGIGIGATVPAIRRIVILAAPSDIGQNLGRLMAIDVGGFACGPAIAAVLVGPFGIAAPFLVIAALTVVALALVWPTKVEETPDDQVPTQRLALDLLRYRPFLGAVVLGSVVYVMIGLFDSLWAVALDDLDAPDWLANVGISLFAVPLIVLSAFGGRLAQRFGAFRLATIGPIVGALAMIGYATVPTSEAMFAVAMVHAVSDGLTIASSGIAAGLTVPPERQAGGQGVLGAVETLAAGITAVFAGVLYQHFGRTFTYTAGAVAMLILTAAGWLLARPAYSLREVPLTAGV